MSQYNEKYTKCDICNFKETNTRRGWIKAKKKDIVPSLIELDFVSGLRKIDICPWCVKEIAEKIKNARAESKGANE